MCPAGSRVLWRVTRVPLHGPEPPAPLRPSRRGVPTPRPAGREGTSWRYVHVRDDHGCRRAAPSGDRGRCQPLGGPGRPLRQPAPRRRRRDRAARGGPRRHRGPQARRHRAALDRRRLSAGLRLAADPLRHAGRPGGPQTGPVARLRALRRRLRAGGPRRQRPAADRGPRAARRRRRDDHAGDAVDPAPGLSRPAGTGDGHRHLERRGRGRRGGRPAARRLPAGALLVGLGLPRQHPADAGQPAGGAAAAARVEGRRPRALGRGRRTDGGGRTVRGRSGREAAGRRGAGGEPAHRAAARAGRGAARGLRTAAAQACVSAGGPGDVPASGVQYVGGLHRAGHAGAGGARTDRGAVPATGARAVPAGDRAAAAAADLRGDGGGAGGSAAAAALRGRGGWCARGSA